MEMPQVLEGAVGVEEEEAPQDKIACLTALERKVLWLSTWMIHNANHLRPNRDGLKVGGHQASSASLATPSSTKATSSRRCSRAGNTMSAISGGSSITTGRASTRSCRTGCSAASTRCSR